MSGLLGYLISIVLLLGVGAIFFYTIDAVAKDAFLAKIAKIAVGCLLLVVFIMATAAVLGMGGAASTISPAAIITFAVGVLVLIVVLYIIDLILTWVAGQMGVAEPIVKAIQYVITVVALIALLILAGNALLGGTRMGTSLGLSSNYFAVPNIMREERR
jgi:hypothetical protein